MTLNLNRIVLRILLKGDFEYKQKQKYIGTFNYIKIIIYKYQKQF
jgi:hypothetical protein